MATVVGEVSAIVSLVEISGRVLASGYAYISKAIRAPDEIRRVLAEVTAINCVLDILLEAHQGDPAGPNALQRQALSKLVQIGATSTCQKLLEEAERSIQKCEKVDGKHARNLAKRLLWPLKAKETTDLLAQLRNARDTINAAVQVDSEASLQRIEASQLQLTARIDTISNALASAAERDTLQVVLNWVTVGSVTPDDTFTSTLKQCQAGSGQWLLDSQEWQTWTESSPSLLWVFGIPGSGKTTLCSAMIHHLKSNLPADSTSVVLYFFHDRNNAQKRELSQLLSTMAGQLVTASRLCFDDAAKLFAARNADFTTQPKTEERVDLIERMLKHFQRIYLLVDAADEAMNPTEVIDAVFDLATANTGRPSIWKILVTSRNSASIEKKLKNRTVQTVYLHERNVSEVKTFVSAQMQALSQAGKLTIRDPALRRLAERTIQQNSKGLFLQAKLLIECLCCMLTDKSIRRELEALGPALHSTYDLMLAQVASRPEETSNLVREALKFLTLSSRKSTTISMLPHAVAALIGNGTFDEEDLANQHRLIEECGSFVLVDRSQPLLPTVNLAHLSVSITFNPIVSRRVILTGSTST